MSEEVVGPGEPARARPAISRVLIVAVFPRMALTSGRDQGRCNSCDSWDGAAGAGVSEEVVGPGEPARARPAISRVLIVAVSQRMAR